MKKKKSLREARRVGCYAPGCPCWVRTKVPDGTAVFCDPHDGITRPAVVAEITRLLYASRPIIQQLMTIYNDRLFFERGVLDVPVVEKLRADLVRGDDESIDHWIRRLKLAKSPEVIRAEAIALVVVADAAKGQAA